MESKNKTQIFKDIKEKSILISREFNAPLPTVWRAYTESNLLEQWWAPAPWKAETKVINFSEGGYWQYAMVGPESEKHWGRMNYNAITHHQNFQIEDVFCDENGNPNNELPVSSGQIAFTETPNGTRVDFTMTYATENDLQKIVEMGFEQGISICLDQLDVMFNEKRI